jgi:Zn-dependent peptidase ImmA (M78 family)/DNA-binding XRE family transcriptional regulator
MRAGNEFNPARLGLARRRRGMTKTRLAKLVGVDVRAISAYESGEFAPEPDRLPVLAQALRFPDAFFFGDDPEEIEADIVSFRSLSKMTAGQRKSALGAGAIALMLNQWIEERFDLPQANLPDLSQEASPEAAADALRRQWGLGELPIKNITHLLESKGVRVFSLALDTTQVDAFSMWHGTTPFAFLNTMKSCERSRFDAAHELGHLVLHRHAGARGQEVEREANAFASALLMPRGSVLANGPHMATVDLLIRRKSFWTVSVKALAYRLRDVGLITDWHFRTLSIEIAQRGYHRNEPCEAPRETSQVLRKVFTALREDGITKADVARALCVYVDELDQLIFGLTMTDLPGGGQRTSTSPGPALRLVGGLIR